VLLVPDVQLDRVPSLVDRQHAEQPKVRPGPKPLRARMGEESGQVGLAARLGIGKERAKKTATVRARCRGACQGGKP
jgi:hypothetical protein